MEHPVNQQNRISLGVLFLLGIGLLIALRLMTTLLWMGIAALERREVFDAPWLTAVMSSPLAILAIPFLLAAIIILWPRRKRPARATLEDGEEGNTVFQAHYTHQQVYRIIRIVLLIWAAITLFQIIFWFAFRSYAP